MFADLIFNTIYLLRNIYKNNSFLNGNNLLWAEGVVIYWYTGYKDDNVGHFLVLMYEKVCQLFEIADISFCNESLDAFNSTLKITIFSGFAS